MLFASSGYVQGVVNELITVKRGTVNKDIVKLPTVGRSVSLNTNCPFSFNSLKPQLNDITNCADTMGEVKRWKRLAREEGNISNFVEMDDQVCRVRF